MFYARNANPAGNRNAIKAMFSGYVRSLLAGHPLPPGDYLEIDAAERGNRLVLIERSEKYGPVFKGLMENRIVICVADAKQARQLLRENSGRLLPVAIDIRRLEPTGFMRQMQGETHRHYRRTLIEALQTIHKGAEAEVFEAVVRDELSRVAVEAPLAATVWASALSRIATGMLVHTVFGALPGSDDYEEILRLYNQLGPNGVAWTVGPKQFETFQALRNKVTSLSETGGIYRTLAERSTLDSAMLANLIYMVELGRYDMRGLFRWISMFAGKHPDMLYEISIGSYDASEAFVTEVLRLEQSERLMRNVTASFVWNGMLIPKGALLRVCMWEEHKRPQAFEDPFEFCPARYKDGYTASFSPFGLDQHRCPFASQTIIMGSIFLKVLARNFEIIVSGGEPPVRGPYHWEPATNYTVTLKPRGSS